MEGIPLDEVTTSMTINPPATVYSRCMRSCGYQGVPLTKIGGTIQNDMLKEFIAQKTFQCPPEPSVKLISDTVDSAQNLFRAGTLSASAVIIFAKQVRPLCRSWLSLSAMA